VFKFEERQRLLERGAKLRRIGRGLDFRLHDHLVARQLRQHTPELHLRHSIAAIGFDVIDAE